MAESVTPQPAPYYQDDACTIYHGDCRELWPVWDLAGAVMVTDPPYGIGHSSNKNGAPLRGGTIAGDESTDARDEVLVRWLPRPVVMFGTCKASVPPMPLRGVLVWDKGAHLGMGDLAFPWKQNWEHIYVSGPGFIGRRDSGVIRSVARSPGRTRGWLHPNEKPVALLRSLIIKCPPLAVVVDPFMGSGSTLRAAKDLGRSAVGVEIEERYCEIAARRLAQEVLAL